MDIQWLLPKPQPMTEKEKPTIIQPELRAGDLLTASVLEVEKGHDALLAFGRFKAYARLPLPVVSGQDIRIQVESAGQHLRLAMVPDGIRTSSDASDDRLAIRLFEPITDAPVMSAHTKSLVPGESLRGRITGFEKDGLMLVDFERFKAFAKIDIPVRQGQIIALAVAGTDNGISLAVAQKTPPEIFPRQPAASVADAGMPFHPEQPRAVAKTIGTHQAVAANPSPPTTAEVAVLREQVRQMLNGEIPSPKSTSLPLSVPIKAALANLTQALNPLSPTGDKATLVENIKAFVENSGVYFEKRLEQIINSLQDRSHPMTLPELADQPAIRDLMVKDIKPNLLILNQFLETSIPVQQESDHHLLETLKSVVGRAVEHIEQQQFSATEKPVHPYAFQVFSHLLFLTDTFLNARLKVYYAKKGRNGGSRQPRVSLLLDMDRMGTVRTDLWMAGKDLNITFFVQDGKTKTAIDADHQRIRAMLKDVFNTVAISVVVNEKKIAQFDGEDLGMSVQRQVDLSI